MMISGVSGDQMSAEYFCSMVPLMTIADRLSFAVNAALPGNQNCFGSKLLSNNHI